MHRQIQQLVAASRHDPSSPLPPSLLLTIRILAADTGKIVRATLPISSGGKGFWYAETAGDASIAGVPGTAAPVQIETPLEGTVLPSGRQLDYLTLGNDQVGKIALV